LNEFFPNPTGPDAAGEFVELYNNGGASVSLDGYVLATDKKKFSLSGRTISAGGYLVLKTSETKLTLKNMNGVLSLYDPDGALVDHATFMGTAPEGKSFSRVDYDAANTVHFAFVDPTPGAANKTIDNQIAAQTYPVGISLVPAAGGGFLMALLGTAILLTGLILYVIHSHEDISELFFRRDEKIW